MYDWLSTVNDKFWSILGRILVNSGAINLVKRVLVGSRGAKNVPPPNSQLLKWGNSTKKDVKTTQNARFLQNLANFGPILIDFWAVKACDKGQRGSREVRKVFPPIPDP